MKEMEKAIKERDFELFGNITMKDSDNFHSVCRDTSPSIEYMK
jgi:diphosphomevalonate decarboxylase